jgi:hypothetical protein
VTEASANFSSVFNKEVWHIHYQRWDRNQFTINLGPSAVAVGFKTLNKTFKVKIYRTNQVAEFKTVREMKLWVNNNMWNKI